MSTTGSTTTTPWLEAVTQECTTHIMSVTCLCSFTLRGTATFNCRHIKDATQQWILAPSTVNDQSHSRFNCPSYICVPPSLKCSDCLWKIDDISGNSTSHDTEDFSDPLARKLRGNSLHTPEQTSRRRLLRRKRSWKALKKRGRLLNTLLRFKASC